MNIGIIGSGHIGGTVGTLWAQAGHSVLFSSRHPHRLQRLAKEAGPHASVGSVEEASEFGEVILFAPPYWEIDDALELAGSLEGKIVIDATNPFTPDGNELALPLGTTSVSELVKRIPRAHIVKAFNTLHWKTLHDLNHESFERRFVLCYAGNEERSKQTVANLIEDAGFIAFDLGPLFNASLMEPGGPFFDREYTVYQAEQVLHSLGRPMQEAA